MKKLLLILAFIVTGTSIAEQNRAEVNHTNEGDEVAYLAYLSGAINSPDDLYTTTCKEQSLEGLQRVGDNWESAEHPLRTYLVTKVKGSSGCDYS